MSRPPARPPFDDTYTWVATYHVPAGQHWIAVGKSWRDGGTPDDCSALRKKAEAAYPSTEANAALTVVESAACRRAKHGHDKWKAVAHDRLLRGLSVTRANKKRALWAARVEKLCSVEGAGS